MTSENDIVLIHFEDKPLSYARVEDISPDSKPGWYHVKLLMLQVPLQVVSWILRDIYIDGSEFTMGGHKMRLEKIVCPQEAAPADNTDDTEDTVGVENKIEESEKSKDRRNDGAEIIAFNSKKKN